MGKELRGLRVALLAADGFEQIELTSPRKTLLRAGAEVDVVSGKRGSIRGVNMLAPGRKVDVDLAINEANPDAYDALLIPGGLMGPDTLRQNDQVLEFVRTFDRERKPIAVICHGPWLLVSAGLVEGRRLTSWPGIQDDVLNAGGDWFDEPVIRDSNWVTSRGPHDLPAFEDAMVKLFSAHVPEYVEEARSLKPWLIGAVTLAAVAYAGKRAWDTSRTSYDSPSI